MAISSGLDLNTVNGVPESQLPKTNTSTEPGGELGQDAFLQLLVTQMQYQDPLDPQDNSEWVSQLAQFSALSAMTNVADQMSALNTTVGIMNSSMLVNSLSSMIGKDIRWTETKTEDGKEETVEHFGQVSSVKVVPGKVSLLVKEYDSDNNLTDKIVEVETSAIEGIGNLADIKQHIKDEENKEE